MYISIYTVCLYIYLYTVYLYLFIYLLICLCIFMSWSLMIVVIKHFFLYIEFYTVNVCCVIYSPMFMYCFSNPIHGFQQWFTRLLVATSQASFKPISTMLYCYLNAVADSEIWISFIVRVQHTTWSTFNAAQVCSEHVQCICKIS